MSGNYYFICLGFIPCVYANRAYITQAPANMIRYLRRHHTYRVRGDIYHVDPSGMLIAPRLHHAVTTNELVQENHIYNFYRCHELQVTHCFCCHTRLGCYGRRYTDAHWRDRLTLCYVSV